MSGIG